LGPTREKKKEKDSKQGLKKEKSPSKRSEKVPLNWFCKLPLFLARKDLERIRPEERRPKIRLPPSLHTARLLKNEGNVPKSVLNACPFMAAAAQEVGPKGAPAVSPRRPGRPKIDPYFSTAPVYFMSARCVAFTLWTFPAKRMVQPAYIV